MLQARLKSFRLPRNISYYRSSVCHVIFSACSVRSDHIHHGQPPELFVGLGGRHLETQANDLSANAFKNLMIYSFQPVEFS